MNCVVFAKILHNVALRLVSEAEAVGHASESEAQWANLARRALLFEGDGFSLAP